MVDHVNKLGPSPYRVDEAKDSLDDEGQKNQGGDDGADKDNFDKTADLKNLKKIYGPSDLWQQNFEVKIEDIERIKFLGINLNTNPPILKMRIFLYEEGVINTAYMSVSRELAMRLKNYKHATYLKATELTNDRCLRIALPQDEGDMDDEVTRVTDDKEKTLSQTFKMLLSKKTWTQRLGIRDLTSRQVNNEIVWAYLTIVVVLSVVLLGLVYLLS